MVLGDKGEATHGPELLDVAGMDWNSAKKTVIELKKNRAKILKGKFWLNH